MQTSAPPLRNREDKKIGAAEIFRRAEVEACMNSKLL